MRRTPRLRPPGRAVEHRAENLLAKEGQHADGLVELTSQELGGAVVKPHPGPVFEPLRASVRPGDVGGLAATMRSSSAEWGPEAGVFMDALLQGHGVVPGWHTLAQTVFWS
jgi:hypothetical protein